MPQGKWRRHPFFSAVLAQGDRGVPHYVGGTSGNAPNHFPKKFRCAASLTPIRRTHRQSHSLSPSVFLSLPLSPSVSPGVSPYHALSLPLRLFPCVSVFLSVFPCPAWRGKRAGNSVPFVMLVWRLFAVGVCCFSPVNCWLTVCRSDVGDLSAIPRRTR